MADEPKVECWRHGLPGEHAPGGGHPGDAPATAIVKDHGLTFALRFAPGDLGAEGDLQEIWIRPGTAELTLHVYGGRARLRQAAGGASTTIYAGAFNPGHGVEDYGNEYRFLWSLLGPGDLF